MQFSPAAGNSMGGTPRWDAPPGGGVGRCYLEAG